MASVEQREATHPAGLTSLELFDKFKALEEDKDSDEESFHLPMLDSEEDLSSNKTPSETIQNGESEDDILNKFECVTTPEPLDLKTEESILNEDLEEDLDSKKNSSEEDDKKNVLENDNTLDKVKTDIPENDDETEEKDVVDIKAEDIRQLDQPEDVFEKVEQKITKEINEVCEMKFDDKMEVDDEIAINERTDDVKMADKEESKESDENEKKESKEGDENEKEEMEDIKEAEKSVNIVSEISKEEMKNVQNKVPDMETDDVVTNDKVSATCEDIVEDIALEQTTTNEEELKEVEKANEDQEHNDITEANPKEDDLIEETKDNSFVEPQITTSKAPKDVEGDEAKDSLSKVNEALITTEKQSTEAIEGTSAKKVDDISEVVNDRNPRDADDISEVVKDGNPKDADDTSEVVEDRNPEDADATSEVVKDGNPEDADDTCRVDEDVNEDSKETEEKSEPEKNTESEANDSANSEHLERDDLLDISVICDVDEDNAKAVAENANDGQSSEKSDNDEQDDKGENEESENEQEENLCSSDKDDAMEFDDAVSNSNSNLQFEENSTNDNVPINNVNEKSDSMDSSDSDVSKEDVEMVDVLPKVIAGLAASNSNKKSSTEDKNQTSEEKTENRIEASANVPEEPVEYLDLDKHMAEQKKILEVNLPCGKRPLSEDDEKSVTPKKMRLSDSPIKADTKKKEGDEQLKMLTSFESFMRTKMFNKKLTKSDLEQFCIQKICEVIMHKTELGELNQLVKKQEQVHEQLRKDIQQLTKQNRDLDIVNKKLMNELKTQNGKQKPLVPLKITRSVGLQVKLNVTTEQTRKRNSSTPIRTNSSIPNNATTPVNNNRQRTVPPTSNVIRQVTPNSTASPRKTPQPTGSTTPILSQALQTPANRQTTTTTPTSTPKRTQIIRPKPSAESTSKPSNPGVIDLTDEDDRATKSPGGASIKIVNKQIVSTPKLVSPKTVGKSPNNQPKMVNINQVKAGQVVNKGTPNRTVTSLPQGVRLTSTTTVKNGIAIPVTSSTGGPQLMYVVQPSSPLVTTTAQGGQKTVLLNFQPGNGILTSALNGSAVSVIPTKANVQVKTSPAPRKHPAPLPLPPPIQPNANLKPLLPKPHLSIRKTETGIILQWRMPYNLDVYECIASYQLFAYQETNAPPSTDMWRKVGDVKALALPMACTLTQFADKNKYYFAVRSVDVHKRIGAFSDPEEISL